MKLVTPGEHWQVQDGHDVGDWLDAIDRPRQRRAVFSLLEKFPAYVARPAGVAA